MTTNDHVNPYEIGKAGARNHGKRIPPITEASVNADKHYSVVPSTGVYGTVWPSSMMAAQDGLLQTLGPSFPQGFQGKISSAGWTKGAEGFEQQTFLGASITNFTINTGFGDSSSSLNVTLVVEIMPQYLKRGLRHTIKNTVAGLLKILKRKHTL